MENRFFKAVPNFGSFFSFFFPTIKALTIRRPTIDSVTVLFDDFSIVGSLTIYDKDDLKNVRIYYIYV